jgi:hypothetical protein
MEMTKHATLWAAIGAVCLVTISASAQAAPAAEANVYINTPGQNDQIVVQPGMQVAVVATSDHVHGLSGFPANTETHIQIDGWLRVPGNPNEVPYSTIVPMNINAMGWDENHSRDEHIGESRAGELSGDCARGHPLG